MTTMYNAAPAGGFFTNILSALSQAGAAAPVGGFDNLPTRTVNIPSVFALPRNGLLAPRAAVAEFDNVPSAEQVSAGIISQFDNLMPAQRLPCGEPYGDFDNRPPGGQSVGYGIYDGFGF